jgi:hypothetical protein
MTGDAQVMELAERFPATGALDGACAATSSR